MDNFYGHQNVGYIRTTIWIQYFSTLKADELYKKIENNDCLNITKFLLENKRSEAVETNKTSADWVEESFADWAIVIF